MKNLVQKHSIWLLAGAAVILAFAAGVLFGEWPVLIIDRQAVYRQELEYNAGSTQQTLRARVIMAWADEYERGRNRTLVQLMREREQENQTRHQQTMQGIPVYGPAQLSPIQYYKRYLADCEQLIAAQLEQQATESQLRDFFKQHEQEYQQIDTICADYAVWRQGELVQQGSVQLDQYTVRGLSEADELFVQQLMQLQQAEHAVWNAADGVQVQLYCTSREQGKAASFEEVSGAVQRQYASELFATELAQRMEAAKVWAFQIKTGGNS